VGGKITDMAKRRDAPGGERSSFDRWGKDLGWICQGGSFIVRVDLNKTYGKREKKVNQSDWGGGKEPGEGKP